MPVHIDPEVLCHNCPYPQIELPPIVQEWFLNILLDHPVLHILISLKYEVRYVPHVPENLNASTLVHGGWLDQPHVLFTMLEGDSLMS